MPPSINFVIDTLSQKILKENPISGKKFLTFTVCKSSSL
jgi:hypothetical protein